MHATDKLREAEFFFGLLRRTDRHADFRYLLSAFLSAARSVTWALQKDLRGRFDGEFDEWYAPRQRALADHPVGGTINRARTVFQKEGNKLYFRQRYPAPDGGGVTFLLEYNLESVPLTAESFSKIGMEFSSTGQTLGPASRDQAALSAWLDANLEPFLAKFAERIQSEPGEWQVSMDPRVEPVPKNAFCDQLESYLKFLSNLVGDASGRFGGL